MRAGRREPAPFYYEPHYLKLIEQSERSIQLACQRAEIRALHRQERMDEGSAPIADQHRLPSTAELEGAELLPRPEPYRQAGVRVANTMRQAREFDRQSSALESQHWRIEDAEDVCLAVLRCVQADTEARLAAGQVSQVPTSPPHLQFTDQEVVGAFRNVQPGVKLGPVSSGPDLEAWPAGKSEDDSQAGSHAQGGRAYAHTADGCTDSRGAFVT